MPKTKNRIYVNNQCIASFMEDHLIYQKFKYHLNDLKNIFQTTIKYTIGRILNFI